MSIFDEVSGVGAFGSVFGMSPHPSSPLGFPYGGVLHPQQLAAMQQQQAMNVFRQQAQGLQAQQQGRHDPLYEFINRPRKKVESKVIETVEMLK